MLHHIIGRGIERRDIFRDDVDRDDFIARVEALAADGAFQVAAWSLMRNHFHLLCKTGNRPISASMHRLLTGYVVNFNKRRRRHGYLFQNRFKSIVCQEDRYLKELVRYIHLNPVRAGQVSGLRGLDRHPFSGHSAVVGRIKRPWQSVDWVLGCFESDSPRRSYREFVAAGLRMGQRPELVGGGLVRSAGGWSAVKALRRRGTRMEHDQRILGDADFVQTTVERSDQRLKQSLRFDSDRPAIDGVCRNVCERYEVSPGELCSGSRRHTVVAARAALSWVAVRELGYSGADVARFLGVTNSCVTRSVAAAGADIAEDARSLIPVKPQTLF
ncbi:MAG: transposase [Desulfobacterales bacterium]|nr:transposase [Desulfobacterales bacterium]